MNVTFHTLTALAAAAVLSSKAVKEPQPSSAHDRLPVLAGGFIAGLLLHGLLDSLPHTYPIKSGLDVVLSLILFVAAIAFARRRHRLLIAMCFVGAVFPDLVDLGPAILNSRFNWSLPVVKAFPWHWRQYSGSIYNRGRHFDSLILHAIVVGLSVSLLYGYRRSLFVLKGG